MPDIDDLKAGVQQVEDDWQAVGRLIRGGFIKLGDTPAAPSPSSRSPGEHVVVVSADGVETWTGPIPPALPKATPGRPVDDLKDLKRSLFIMSLKKRVRERKAEALPLRLRTKQALEWLIKHDPEYTEKNVGTLQRDLRDRGAMSFRDVCSKVADLLRCNNSPPLSPEAIKENEAAAVLCEYIVSLIDGANQKNSGK
jgi:hypothetical protein